MVGAAVAWTLWTARVIAMLLGVFGWVLSFYLAYLTFGNKAPDWLFPGIIVFGVAFFAASAGVLIDDAMDAGKQHAERIAQALARQNDLVEAGQGLVEVLDGLLQPAHGLEMKMASLSRLANESGEATYPGQHEDKAQLGLAKLKAEDAFLSHKTKTFHLLRRFAQLEIDVTDATLKQVERGWFTDIELLIPDLASMVIKVLRQPPC
jgi:hypothetical protein